MKLFKQKYLYWILQVGGWSFLLFFTDLCSDDYSLKYKVISCVLFVFSGIFCTSVFRYFLKHKILIKPLNAKLFFEIFIGLLFASSLFLILGGFFEKFFEDIFRIKDENPREGTLIGSFMSSCFVISIWTLSYIVIKLVIKNSNDTLERLKLTNALRDAQLNTLKGQINPHFMFNSLNNIRGLMLEDVDRSREMITKLSDMLRYSLTKNGNDAILLEEELDMVDNYIALSKIQMEDRLQFVKQIDDNLKKVSIPPMLIQLLVENAAKHGIANQKNGGVITLTTKKQENDLIIEVRNTGELNIAKNSTQLGLENIKQRLHLLYGEKASFSLVEQNNEVIATIKISEYESH